MYLTTSVQTCCSISLMSSNSWVATNTIHFVLSAFGVNLFSWTYAHKPSFSWIYWHVQSDAIWRNILWCFQSNSASSGETFQKTQHKLVNNLTMCSVRVGIDVIFNVFTYIKPLTVQSNSIHQNVRCNLMSSFYEGCEWIQHSARRNSVFHPLEIGT